jgi:hypothetical protein
MFLFIHYYTTPTFSKCSKSKQSELRQKISGLAVGEKKLKKSFFEFSSFL